MKFFQIVHKYPPYIDSFEERYNIKEKYLSFEELINLLIEDGFMACHLLKPIFEKDKHAFYTIWDYERLQYKWAEENGIKTADLKEIIYHQLVKNEPEVIYNMSANNIQHDIFSRLSFKPKLVCWNADGNLIMKLKFDEYDKLLTSSPNILDLYENACLFYPSNDKFMKIPAENNKTIDILFYGQYNPGIFKDRVAYINNLIPFLKKNNINFKFHIMYTTWKKPIINRRYLWNLPFLQKKNPPLKISKHFSVPIFGKEIYKQINKSKIVFNIAGGLDEFKSYKSNMRIFETLGTGTFMLSDEGIYPEHIISHKDFVSYNSVEDLKEKILYYLKNNSERDAIAESGRKKIEKYYSKERQWKNFKSIIEKI